MYESIKQTFPKEADKEACLKKLFKVNTTA